MFAKDVAFRRWSLGPCWFIIGYVLVLLATTVGVVMFPFSVITMGLFYIIIIAFFLMVIPFLVLAYLFLAVAADRALIKFGRRLLSGAGHGSAYGKMSKSTLKQDKITSEPMGGDLWDRWIDGAR